jgi:lipopolysaccharide/colanic/teichoic acid biosynthesis glycosyltransferase
MYHKILADGFFVFAAIAILASMYSWSVEDIFLASTQWILISAVLLLMAIYIRLSRDDDEMILRERKTVKPRKKKVAAAKGKKKKHMSFRLSA